MHQNNVQHVHENNMCTGWDEQVHKINICMGTGSTQEQDEHRDDMINIRRECNTGMG